MFGRWSARRRIAAGLIERGRAAQAERRWREAATLYGEALRLVPNNAAIHVQRGHVCKEAGDLAEAERHYEAADRLRPGDADLALQFGHLFKVAGRHDEAEAAYARALALAPGWDIALAELANVRGEPATEPDGDAAIARGLAPALAPLPPERLRRSYTQGIELRRLGSPGLSGRYGLPTLAGLEAIRGVCLSPRPIEQLEVALDGRVLHHGPVRGPYPLPLDAGDGELAKYVFNIWLDFTSAPRGRAPLELRCRDTAGRTLTLRRVVLVADPAREADYPHSDALLTLDPADPRPPDEQVRARPSMIRPAERRLFVTPPRAILVQRTDQLGDMIASVPAVSRLRELFPQAHIVGLLTAANDDLAATLGLFDEVITIDFPDDPVERRRLMPLDEQEALRRRLAEHRFDIAIDLSQAGVSRDLLRLSGAPFLYGVGDGWPWLTAGFDLNTHDLFNRMDIVPHGAKVLAMVESLGALVRDPAPPIRRADLSRDPLAAFGIRDDERYVVLHLGARIAFSRWPRFAELAQMLLARTDLRVVMMTEDPSVRATLPPALARSDRLTLIDRRLGFDDFDALVSFAAVLVGNDSGPKHLASLRGVSTVTLFTARINWSEWGQERGGAIISRRVPCAGCAIFHDAEECGQNFACIADIGVDEVFETLTGFL